MPHGTAKQVGREIDLEFLRPGEAPSFVALPCRFKVRQKGLTVESDPLAADLVEIAAAVHLADRMVRRSMRSGHRPRVFDLVIPVSDPARWAGVRDRVEGLAEFASQDLWRVAFVSRHVPQFEMQENPRAASVALFSGGLDSLCGAAQLYRRSRPTLLMTHSPPGADRVRSMIEALGSDAHARISSASLAVLPHQRDAQGRRNRFQEFTRRTRPFLYLSVAAAAALVSGAEEVQMSENGALGASLPFRRSHHGPRITRQGHSWLMHGFEELLAVLCPDRAPIRFVNPYAEMTKGEACAASGIEANAAALTLSCEYAGQQIARVRSYFRGEGMDDARLEARQCGICVPCIVRRAALRRAGLADPDTDYFFDAAAVARGEMPPINPATGAPPPLYVFASVHPVYARRYATGILEMDESDFSRTYFNELAALWPPVVRRSAFAAALDLQRRFARELLGFFDG